MHLVPQPLSVLLSRLVSECQTAGTGPIFDLPRHRCYVGSEADLSVQIFGRRAATPIGPAAGPHTQLAQNLALAWLAGARVMELKTVQQNDTLTIPRPCIDIENIGFNVEWSQELRLSESLTEYAKGWLLIAALQKLNPLGLRAAQFDTVFEVSIGYSLAGIQSEPIGQWLDAMRTARPVLQTLREQVPPALRSFLPEILPEELSHCVTLSTFHGCPPDEIERIVEHLFCRHGFDVVVKFNPTLLGLQQTRDILHGQLGYNHLGLVEQAFADDLCFEDALSMMSRLQNAARRAGRQLGAKFSNTLVVKNHKPFFPASQTQMYLSGQPLHVLAIELAARFARATGGTVPISFSGGIDQKNCAQAVAAGLLPVTVCTDLLRPGGYGRMAKYLSALPQKMTEVGASSLAELVQMLGGLESCLTQYAHTVLQDPRYAYSSNAGSPKKVQSSLWLFDCLSCDKCVAVCPNDANFAVPTKARPEQTSAELVLEMGTLRLAPAAPLLLSKTEQFLNFADACNECGNCDVFCPEEGGPYKRKPRVFSTRDSYAQADSEDGFFIERHLMLGRLDGTAYTAHFSDEGDEFSDGIITAKFGPSGRIQTFRQTGSGPTGHRLKLWAYYAMRTIYDGLLGSSNYVSAKRSLLP